MAEGEVFERLDPCTDDAVASRAHAAGADLVGRAVAAARDAAGAWRRAGFAERGARLRAVAGGIGEPHLELAAVASLETGKSRTESILEVQEAIDLITTYAGHMEANDGYVTPLASFVENERNSDVLRPYGIFAVIAPFNFPAALSTVTRVGSFDEALAEANAPVYGLTAGIFSEDAGEVERFLDEVEAGVVYVNRRAGATTGAWPGTQSFCGWKSSGATGKGGLGPYYVAQFMREQSRTVVG